MSFNLLHLQLHRDMILCMLYLLNSSSPGLLFHISELAPIFAAVEEARYE
eukprot:c5925_g1_i1 orf=92-241(+)